MKGEKMSIEYRGENKFRFRVKKDGVNYTQNYYCEKMLFKFGIKWKVSKELNQKRKILTSY
jgi:hypothetical protein